MRKQSLLKLQQRLLQRRREILPNLEEDRTEAVSLRGPRDADDDPPEDEGTAVTSQLAAMEQDELRRIERALTKIRDGSYGICEACHRRIPVVRLMPLPYTEVCIVCQRKREETGYEDEE